MLHPAIDTITLNSATNKQTTDQIGVKAFFNDLDALQMPPEQDI
jgi:hypothetical protein